jgi:hypothetical protein
MHTEMDRESIQDTPRPTPCFQIKDIDGRLSNIVGDSHQGNGFVVLSGIESSYARIESVGMCGVESMRE